MRRRGARGDLGISFLNCELCPLSQCPQRTGRTRWLFSGSCRRASASSFSASITRRWSRRTIRRPTGGCSGCSMSGASRLQAQAERSARSGSSPVPAGRRCVAEVRFPCGKYPASRPLAGAVRDQGSAGQRRTRRSLTADNPPQNRRKAASAAHRGDQAQRKGNVATAPTRAGWCGTGKTTGTCGNGGCRVLGEAGRPGGPVGLWLLGVPHRSRLRAAVHGAREEEFFLV
jgi:hypothetical protein